MENVLQMSAQAARTTDEQFHRTDRPGGYKDWPALLRLLDRRGIRYRD
jgi:hypothetical protein